MKLNLIFGIAALIVITVVPVRGDDWPQFRGPSRDDISRETNLMKQWPKDGPKLLWTVSNLGIGYSGPAIVGDRLYISCARDQSEMVVALDLKAGGKELWSARIGPVFSWEGNNWNRGPNATPTVDGDYVYALGGRGDLVCVEKATGGEMWRRSLARDFHGEVNPIGGGTEDPTPLGWGYAAAPLVDGNQLICVPGGKQGLIVAFDKVTGQILWQSKDVTDQATYSSPIVIEAFGTRQYVQVTNGGIVGIAAKDGKKLWSYRRSPAYDDVVIATPIFSDNHIFTSVGFGQGCDLIKLITQGDGIDAEKVFSNTSIQNRDGGMVLVNGHVYGYSENRGWFCMEFKTGNILWAEKRQLGRGSLTYADGNLYCCAEKGGVVAMIEASPAGWNEKGRLQLPRESALRRPSGGLWTHPVVSNGRLFIRDQEMLYCYNLHP